MRSCWSLKGQWNRQREHGEPIEQQVACFAHAPRVWLTVHYKSSVTSANEFDVRSILHSCQSCLCRSIYSFKDYFKYVNIGT